MGEVFDAIDLPTNPAVAEWVSRQPRLTPLFIVDGSPESLRVSAWFDDIGDEEVTGIAAGFFKRAEKSPESFKENGRRPKPPADAVPGAGPLPLPVAAVDLGGA